MKAMKRLLTVLLLTYSGVVLAAKPIENIVDVAVPEKTDGGSLSLEQIRNAIVAGCKYKRWTPVVDEEGKVSCSILVRARHYAEVDIPFTESSFSIMYKDSRELDYNEAKQRIHRNYNKWVIMLSETVQHELANVD